MAAMLTPKDVKDNKIHPAGSFWLAHDDKLIVTQLTEYSFVLDGGGVHLTCTFSNNRCVQANGVSNPAPVNAAGAPPPYAVEVLECPGQNMCDDPAKENIKATLNFYPPDEQPGRPFADLFAHLLEGTEVPIAEEDAVYQLRPIFAGPDQEPFRGEIATSTLPVTFVSSMSGREFLRKLTPSQGKWIWTVGPAGNAAWDVNFSPRLQVTQVQVLQGYPKATQGPDSLLPEDESKLVPIVPGGIDVGSSSLAPTCWSDPTVVNMNMQRDGNINLLDCRLHQSQMDPATAQCLNPPGKQKLSNVTPAYVNQTGSTLMPLTWSVRFDSGCPVLIMAPTLQSLQSKPAASGGRITETLWIRFIVEAPPISVSVSPTSASVAVNGTQQFTATVQNSTNTAVTWQVNGVTGGNATVGTISTTGLYTAPASVPNPNTVTVTAVSQADPSKSGSATVEVVP